MTNIITDHIPNNFGTNYTKDGLVEYKVKNHFNNDSYFLARELEYVIPQSYDVLYADTSYKKMFPVASTVDWRYQSWVYRVIKEYTSGARAISNPADDYPTVDINGEEKNGRLQDYGARYEISSRDLAAGSLTNRNIEQAKITAVLRALDQKMNTIAFEGDKNFKIDGLFTLPGIDKQVVADGTGGKTWGTKTADEIIKDLNDGVSFVVDTTNDKEKPDTIALPLEKYLKLVETPRSNVSDTTIKEYFLSTNPYIKEIMPIPELKGSFTGSSNGLVIYKKSQEKMWFEMPLQFVGMQPQLRNDAAIVNFKCCTAGLILTYPKSICFRYGI